jgi:hypothetical protein
MLPGDFALQDFLRRARVGMWYNAQSDIPLYMQQSMITENTQEQEPVFTGAGTMYTKPSNAQSYYHGITAENEI